MYYNWELNCDWLISLMKHTLIDICFNDLLSTTCLRYIYILLDPQLPAHAFTSEKHMHAKPVGFTEK